MNSIYPLFCYPVMVCSQVYRFTPEEEAFIAGLTMAENVGNAMSRNDRILDDPTLANMKAFVEAQIAVYQRKILCFREENRIYITQSWANKAKAGDFHPKHKHPNSLLSGVFFVTGAEGDGLPPIRFHRRNDLLPLDFEVTEINDFNTGMRSFDARKGLLILFPSVLEHDVDRNDTGQERITLSFNTFASGALGGRAQLTHVDLPE